MVYKILMQNYNVGDRVFLLVSSGPDGGSDGRQLTDCDFVARIFSWRIHRPNAGWDVAQDTRDHIYVPHLSLTPTRLTMQVGLLSKDNTEQIPFVYKSTSPVVPVMKLFAQGFNETFCRPVPIEFVGV